MKRYSILVLLMISISQVHAQQDWSAQSRAAKVTDWMKANLQLNETQVMQVEPINLKYANRAQSIKNDKTLTRGQKLEALRADDLSKDNDLKSVLTQDQFKTYQAKKEEMKKQMKQKMKSKNKGR